MNAAPWANKNEVAAQLEVVKADLRDIKINLENHTNGPGHASSLTEMATVKATMSTMQDTLREIKLDVKEIKDRGNGRR